MGENIQLMSLNVRGIQTMKKRKDYFEWLDKFSKSIIMLQETHTSVLDENNYKNHWGHSTFFSHGTTNYRGVVTILPNSLGGTSKLFYSDLDGRILIVELSINDTLYYLVNIYAPSSNKEVDKINFLNKLTKELTQLKNNNIITGGDWNVVLDPEMDKKGGTGIDNAKFSKYRQLLKEFILELTSRIVGGYIIPTKNSIPGDKLDQEFFAD